MTGGTRPRDLGRWGYGQTVTRREGISLYQPEDALPVARLVDEIWGHDPVLRQIYDIHGLARADPLRRTLVCRMGKEVVAVASAELGPRHPARLWLAIHVRPRFRRNGLATRLLGCLRQQLDDARPFRTTSLLSDEGTIAFLRGHGFTLLNRCQEGTLDPGDVRLRVALDEKAAASAAEIVLARPPRDGVARAAEFFARWYQATHSWDPPVSWTRAEALDHFCGEVIVRDSLVFAYDDELLVGVGSLIRLEGQDGRSGGLYLNQLGVLDARQSLEPLVAAKLLARLLEYARGHGELVSFEVDEANRCLWQVFEELRLEPKRVIGNFGQTIE